MRFIDEKGRLFGRISVIDVLVIVVLLSAASYFVYARFVKNLREDISSREQPIEFTVAVMGIRPGTAEAIQNGARMFEFKTGAYVGTVKEVRTEPAQIWTIHEDGRWLLAKSQDRVDAYVTIAGTARVGENVITVNGVEVRVGSTIGLQSKFVVFTGNVVSMKLLPGGSPQQ